MEQFTLAEFAKNSENKEDSSFTPAVQEEGIPQGALIVSRLYNTMLGEITKSLKSWNAELVKILTEAGITPSSLSNEQLYNAIMNIVNSNRGFSIGTIYFSQSSSISDNPGALPLFTGEVIGNINSVYPDFYAWLVAHPELCVTLQTWNDTYSTYGECPYYVLDTVNNTVKLPKLVNYIKCANTVDGVSQSAAGLPNITGNIGRPSNWNNGIPTGAFYSLGSERAVDSAGNAQSWEYVAMDASRSSSVYGKSNTVTPANTTLYPWVAVYSTAVSASVAQAAEFQTALSSKLDIAGGTMTGTLYVPTPASTANNTTVPTTEWVMQRLGELDMLGRMNYNSAIQFTLGNNQSYTAPSKGYFWLRNYSATVSINGQLVGASTSQIESLYANLFIPVSQGDVLSVSNGNTDTRVVGFFAPQL